MSTTTLHVAGISRGRGLPYIPPRSVEMPGVTTMGYAAMRVAEALGMDPQGMEYFLLDGKTYHVIPPDDLAAQHDGAWV